MKSIMKKVFVSLLALAMIVGIIGVQKINVSAEEDNKFHHINIASAEYVEYMRSIGADEAQEVKYLLSDVKSVTIYSSEYPDGYTLENLDNIEIEKPSKVEVVADVTNNKGETKEVTFTCDQNDVDNAANASTDQGLSFALEMGKSLYEYKLLDKDGKPIEGYSGYVPADTEITAPDDMGEHFWRWEATDGSGEAYPGNKITVRYANAFQAIYHDTTPLELVIQYKIMDVKGNKKTLINIESSAATLYHPLEGMKIYFKDKSFQYMVKSFIGQNIKSVNPGLTMSALEDQGYMLLWDDATVTYRDYDGEYVSMPDMELELKKSDGEFIVPDAIINQRIYVTINAEKQVEVSPDELSTVIIKRYVDGKEVTVTTESAIIDYSFTVENVFTDEITEDKYEFDSEKSTTTIETVTEDAEGNVIDLYFTTKVQYATVNIYGYLGGSEEKLFTVKIPNCEIGTEFEVTDALISELLEQYVEDAGKYQLKSADPVDKKIVVKATDNIIKLYFVESNGDDEGNGGNGGNGGNDGDNNNNNGFNYIPYIPVTVPEKEEEKEDVKEEVVEVPEVPEAPAEEIKEEDDTAEVEVQVPEVPEALPKTGNVGVELFFGLGSFFATIGAAIIMFARRKK